jgi:hypothetical protein
MENATTNADLPRLYARGQELDTSPDAFGFLRDSSEVAGDADALRERMAEDGYLFLPGLLNRDEVIEARRVVTDRLLAEGLLDPDYPAMAGRLRADKPNPYFKPELTRDNAALARVLYDGPMMELFTRFFGEPVRHFDFTWFRAVGPGKGTAPHCDVVYMGRGTKDLYTAWTPVADIPLTVGGLMVLEGSHRESRRIPGYLEADVDTYCENGPNAEAVRTGEIRWEHWEKWQTPGAGWSGAITDDDPPGLRERLGGRWLTAREYRMGDVLIFSMRTVHASIDNQTATIRLSSDSRYQRASDPADERWISGPNGEAPPAHGLTIKRGRIC